MFQTTSFMLRCEIGLKGPKMIKMNRYHFFIIYGTRLLIVNCRYLCDACNFLGWEAFDINLVNISKMLYYS